MKKLCCLLLCIAAVMISFSACSKPPEYGEIEDRFKELIEKSYAVNDILFGEGLPVYEKVYENKFSVYRDDTTNKVYYYYSFEDGELGTVYGYRVTENLYFIRSSEEKPGETAVYTDADGAYYYQITYNGSGEDKDISSYEDTESGEKYYFYKIEDEKYGTVYEYRLQSMRYLVRSEEIRKDISPEYTDSENGYYYYPVEYQEKEYEFYYDENDPDGYSYVRLDCEYSSIELIKEYAETVYSKQYLEGVYEMLFTGAVVSEGLNGSLGARYYVYEDSDEGKVWLLKSDEYESMIQDRRIYDFSTAKVVKPGNSKFVNIEIESYLEKQPETRITVKLSMIMQDDGEWYLDNATY